MNAEHRSTAMALVPFALAVTFLSPAQGDAIGPSKKPLLLKRAHRLTTFESQDTTWGVYVVSAHSILFLRVSGLHHVTLILRDLRNGTDKPLQVLSRLFHDS